MILTVFFAILTANGVSSEQIRVLAEGHNGGKIPIDINVKNGSVTTVSGQPYPAQPFFRPSVNLYEFDKKLEARKVIDEGICYIRKFTGTLDQMKQLVNAAKADLVIAMSYCKKGKVKGPTKASEHWNIPGKEIKAGELKQTVGAEIADFCNGYKVFWMNGNKKVTKLQARRTRPWNAYIKPTYSQGSGFGASGGLRYNNGKGFSANVGGGWSQGGGFSASAGLSWSFGK